MKYIEKIIKAAVREIETPYSQESINAEIKNVVSGAASDKGFTDVCEAAFELIKIINNSAGKIGSYESIASYIRAGDFILARNLIAFGLITALAFLTFRFCSPENVIYSLYGVTAFYIFLILLTPNKIKKYRLLKLEAVREYRENLILFSCALIKKHSLDPSLFSINLKGSHVFMNLSVKDGIYFFKTL